MKKFFVIITILFVSISINGKKIKPVSKIIVQRDCPIEITSYDAKYKSGGKYTREGIHHSLRWKNSSEKVIVAVQFGLVSFNVWNNFLDRMNGVNIENLPPGKEDMGTWIARAYADFSFLTGFSYVSKVRLEDGTIWNCNLEEIKAELQKVEEEFDIKNLQGKSKRDK